MKHCLVVVVSLCVSNAFKLHTNQIQRTNLRRCNNLSNLKDDRIDLASIKNDIGYYALLAAIQFLPPISILNLPDAARKPLSYSFFLATASLAVYLGSKRQDIKQIPSIISQKSAVLAPIFSSVLILGLYALLKYTNVEIFFDKGYQILGTFLGLNCIDTVVTAVLTPGIPDAPNEIEKINLTPDESALPLSSSVGLAVGGSVALAYLLISNFAGANPDSFYYVSFFNNLLATSIALQAIGSIRVESFAIACAFLVGLFFYDIFWVFGTDVMMTVATKVEAPIKFLFPADPASIAHRTYPYSVLGLGDIVVPGIMCALGRRLDVTGMAVKSTDSSIV